MLHAGAPWEELSHNSDRRGSGAGEGRLAQSSITAGRAAGWSVNTSLGSVYFLESVFPSLGLLLCLAVLVPASFMCPLGG